MNTRFSRRRFLNRTVLGACALAPTAPACVWAAASRRRMTICLSPGSIGVQADARQAIQLAGNHGYESVEAFPQFLAGLSTVQLEEVQAEMKAKHLVWGMAGLPVDFRGTDERFAEGVRGMPQWAAGLQRAGATRVGTWLSPSHPRLSKADNFEQHRRRLREVALVLKDHGLRLGLEYVGPLTSRRGRIAFVHTLAGVKELIAAIGTGNVGVVLDSWHWYTAGETEADLRTLNAAEVVSVDLNDAPAGLSVDLQIDSQRELPCATGVIPVGRFLASLTAMEYDGPVRAEPFNKAVNDLPNDEACARVVQAMRKAMALVG